MIILNLRSISVKNDCYLRFYENKIKKYTYLIIYQRIKITHRSLKTCYNIVIQNNHNKITKY